MQLVSSPNPAEPYPKSSTWPTKFQKGLRPQSAPHHLGGPSLEISSLWKPPDHLAPSNCSTPRETHCRAPAGTQCPPASAHGTFLPILLQVPGQSQYLIPLRNRHKRDQKCLLTTGNAREQFPLTLPLPLWDKCLPIFRPQFSHL